MSRPIAAVLAAKTVRTYCYGFLGILLPVYLSDLGVDAQGVGTAVTLTLVGSALATLPSAPLIRRLAALFALDSFAGGFVLQSLVVYYLHLRHGLDLDALGWVFFAAQLLTAASLLVAAGLARRFGLLNTMVVSHLVSNVFLIAI